MEDKREGKRMNKQEEGVIYSRKIKKNERKNKGRKGEGVKERRREVQKEKRRKGEKKRGREKEKEGREEGEK